MFNKAPVKVHELKILPVYFAAVLTGKKTFEIRKEDKARFEVGDSVILKEYDAEKQVYTAAQKIVKITYVLRDVPEYGLASGYCIFGFK